ncbi:hypothetical protein PHMEG_00035778 [Phytophthora megakarya]|uniref:Bzip transcription factor n=1 Tax=Phytophthora megakarya TaxID=4795 RepID=A0A225UMX8_9STRA|nr:hypothetical protein PHMEG_00035778 [Phytophthora megakarya]
MLPLLRGQLPPEDMAEINDTSQLARRFARAVTHRQRLSVIGHNTLQRRRHPQSRNCTSTRRQVNRTSRLQAVNQQQLNVSIRALQADIATLERSAMLRDEATVVWRINCSSVALDLTREYYLQLQHGYDSSDKERSAVIDRYMSSVFRPDIFCRDFQGIQDFMGQWEKYTTFHQGLEIKLQSMRIVDSDDDPQCVVTVHANAEMSVTFTQDTVKFLYPALFEKSLENAEEREIVNNLVGSTGCLPVELVLNFDHQGRVFSFESRVNLVATLLNVLHSPSAAIHAHQASCISSDGHWQVEQNAEELTRRERMLPRQLL